jgi:hypothetical protein
MVSIFQTATRRTVRCLHCATPFVVPGAATTLTCPVCYKRVRVDDVIITGRQSHHRLETCGVVVVKKFASVHADLLASGTGIVVEGEVHTRAAKAPSIVMGPEAVWNGDLEAHTLTIDPASTIKGGKFSVKPPREQPNASAPKGR